MRLLFAGTPSTAVPALRALLDSDHDLVAVLTRPPARSGRGRRTSPSPVAQAAEQAGIEVLTPAHPSDGAFVSRLRELDVDCCPVVAYGAILPGSVLGIPRHGWVNLHFSLLPAWRGAAPVQRAILHGDDVTGASTFQIEAGLDTGPVFGVVTEAIRPDDTAGSLLQRLADSGAGLLKATMDGIEAGAVVAVPQSGEDVSIAPKVSVDEAHVDWTAPARHIDRLIRACTPAPGAWTHFRGDRVKLGPVAIRAGSDLGPGELAVEKAGVRVGTATLELGLGTVQVPGKRPVPAADWARGARIDAGEHFA